MIEKKTLGEELEEVVNSMKELLIKHVVLDSLDMSDPNMADNIQMVVLGGHMLDICAQMAKNQDEMMTKMDRVLECLKG